MEESYYKTVVERSPLAFATHKIICDECGIPVDYEFIEVNAAFETMTGLVAKNIVGCRVTAVLPAIRESKFDWIAFYGDVAINAGHREFEEFSEPLKRWYRVTVYSHQEYYFTTCFTDITEQKKNEETLRNLNERLRLATAAGKVGVFEYDVVNNVLSCDGQALSIYKKTAEQLNTLEKWLDIVHPEDLARVIAEVVKALNGKKDMDFDETVRVIFPKGEIRQIRSTAVVQKCDEGKPRFAMGTIQDVTPQRRSLEMFAKAFDAGIGSKTIIRMRDCCYINVNDAFLEQFGLERKDVVGSTPYDLNLFSYKTQAEELRKVFYNNKRTDNFEVELLAKDNELRTMLYSSEQIALDDELCLFMTSIDITERKKMERELSQAKIMAESANIARGRFLSNMSHEIRTPLNSIVGFLTLLEETALPAEQEEYVKHCLASSEILLGLINDILDFAKIDAGKLVLEKSTVNIREKIANIVLQFSHKANKKGIKIFHFVKENVPESVFGDSLRLGQVLINLLSNALKFTKVGEVAVEAEMIEKLDSAVVIRFTVSDTGVGMKEEVCRKLFQPFMQADRSITRKYGGTGLGLAISKELVKLMNGEITVVSEENKGSRFSFTARFGVEGTFDTDVVETSPAIEGHFCKNVASVSYLPRILLVEDDLLNRKMLSEMLKHLGLACEIAENGQEAYHLCRKKGYDIVFMDCQMPVMDGYEATKKIRELAHGDECTIIAMTARTMAGDRAKCLLAGMDDYIAKPMQFSTLSKTINKYVQVLNGVYG